MDYKHKTARYQIYRLLIIACCIIVNSVISVSASTNATISYAYDQAGRRVGREIVLSQNDNRRNSPNVKKPSIMDELAELKFTVCPNPTSGIVNLVFNCNSKLQGSVSIINSAGTQISSKDLDESMQFDLESHPRGIYFMIISYGENSVTYKIIKE